MTVQSRHAIIASKKYFSVLASTTWAVMSLRPGSRVQHKNYGPIIHNRGHPSRRRIQQLNKELCHV